jgi:hypothetical protein
MVNTYCTQAKFLTVNSMPLNRLQSQLSGAGAEFFKFAQFVIISSFLCYNNQTYCTTCIFIFTMKKYCAMKKFILTFVDKRIYRFKY